MLIFLDVGLKTCRCTFQTFPYINANWIFLPNTYYFSFYDFFLFNTKFMIFATTYIRVYRTIQFVHVFNPSY
jgi:hypothetical protein